MAKNGSHCKPITSQEAGEIINWLCSLRETSARKEETGNDFWVGNQTVCYIVQWEKG